MRENTKRALKTSTSGKHVVGFAFLGLLLAGATFVLGVSTGRRMAQPSTHAHEKNPLLASDKKTEALAQIQLQQAQRQQAQAPSPLTFQEELLKPIPIAVPAPAAASTPAPAVEAPAPKPVERTTLAESAPTPAVVARQGSLKEAFLEFQQEGKEVSRKEASTGAAAEKEWTLQVSSHKGQEEAERMAAKLSNKGYAAYVATVELGERGTWHRVRVGQFSSKQEAEVLADTLMDDMRMSAPLVISLK